MIRRLICRIRGHEPECITGPAGYYYVCERCGEVVG